MALMRRAMKRNIHLSRVALLCFLAVAMGCVNDDYMALYTTAPKPPSLSWEDIEDLAHMGPTIVDDGVNFCVFSENATRVELALFDDPESTQPTQQFLMTQYGDVWNLYVEGIGVGQHYGYIAWGPNWEYDETFYPYSTIGFTADADEHGNRFNPNKLLADPYAKAYHRPHDWMRGNVASGPWRDESTYAAGAKSVVVTSDYQWSTNETTWREQRQQKTNDLRERIERRKQRKKDRSKKSRPQEDQP